jgi:hypothetical protein
MSKNKVITKTTVIPESNQSPQKNKNLENMKENDFNI